MGSNPAVGAGFFPARKTGVCYGYGAGVALGSQTEHSYLVHLIITPCISCLPYAREPEARPLGWLALKSMCVWVHILIGTKSYNHSECNIDPCTHTCSSLQVLSAF